MLSGLLALREGDSGSAVAHAQSLLSAAGHPTGVDGAFGPRTAKATASFQRRAGLSRDAVIGRRTAKALDEGAGAASPEPPAVDGLPGWALPEEASTDVAAVVERGRVPEPERGAGPTEETAPELTAACDAVIAHVPRDMREHAKTSVPAILGACRTQGVRDHNQVAYILATAQHESAFGATKYKRSEPLVEDHNPYRQGADGNWSATNHLSGQRITAGSEEALEIAYWDSLYGKTRGLGNRRGTSDGANYKGRGFVQLTGRRNYEDMSRRLNATGFSYTAHGVTYGGKGNPPIDLLAHPTHVNEVPEVAAHILVLGSTQGTFTGRSLGDYMGEGRAPDFFNARSVINGDKKKNGSSIADLASGFASVLRGPWRAVFPRAHA